LAESKPLIMVLNGPNLNLLGGRETGIYGAETLADIETACARLADELGYAIDFRQTNSESELVDWIQEATAAAGILINAGAYTHTSVAILDALRAIDTPAIEVHLSNIHQREPFRHQSYVSQAAAGMICGFRGDSYLLALRALDGMLKRQLKEA
jgi:3-dehydroquinate dehydratase-2